MILTPNLIWQKAARLLAVVLLIVATLPLSACWALVPASAWEGDMIDITRISEITAGTTTTTQVEALFGKPKLTPADNYYYYGITRNNPKLIPGSFTEWLVPFIQIEGKRVLLVMFNSDSIVREVLGPDPGVEEILKELAHSKAARERKKD